MLKAAVSWVLGMLIVAALAGDVRAQNIERGKLKSLDLEKKLLVVTVDGKDRELTLSDQTQVLDARGNTLAEKLADFKTGVELQFVAAKQDGKETARALRLVRAGVPQADAQRGRLAKIDADRQTVTLVVEGKDLELALVERTQVQGARGKTAAERLRTYRPNAELEFFSTARDGKQMLVSIRIATGQLTSPEHQELKPLTEMGSSEYLGFAGGLYPQGKNERPSAHDAAGRKLADAVRPLNAEGQPDDNGKIVLLSLGMSNASQVSDGLTAQLRTARGTSPRVQFVNGAQGGMIAEATVDPEDGGRGTQFWRVVDERLQQAGVTRAQVQAVWIKQADAGAALTFPEYPQRLQRELTRVAQIITERFPNARLCYLSSRTYGGFATTALNPEPIAYESGFAVKWLIEAQINGAAELNYDPAKGPVKAPWLGWGPYLWANGRTPRSDGFFYEPADFAEDGTHHARSGTLKTGELLLKFFQNDETTKPWFIAR